MQMYVNYYDRFAVEAWEAPTVGIVLCSDKNEAMVRITLPDDARIHTSRYQLYLPTERELRQVLLAQHMRTKAVRQAGRAGPDTGSADDFAGATTRFPTTPIPARAMHCPGA